MELFSKRYGNRIFRIRKDYNQETGKFINDSLRNRLLEEIRYISSSEKFIESFLLYNVEGENKIILNADNLSKLSLRELGYDISNFFNFYKFSFNSVKDLPFFDLLEILIIFSKVENRTDFVQRLEYIFKEEKDEFIIHEFMIVSKGETSLQSIIPLLKDGVLKEKLIEFERNHVNFPNYQLLSRISADMIQYLFSSTSKTDTKKYTDLLCKQIAKKWTTSSKVPELHKLISDFVILAKQLNNQISNIRHSDKNTIQLENPSLYKLISLNNIRLAEMVILSLPNEYIIKQNAETLKQDYVDKYKIDKDDLGTIRYKTTDDDLPF